MNTLLLTANPFVDRFIEGGPFFMTLILICLLLSLFFIIVGFLKIKTDKAKSKKMLRLASDSGLLGLTIGFLGSVIGLITAFDFIESVGNVNPDVFAGGLKVSLLTTTFGLVTFVIGRIGIVILRWMIKEQHDEVS